MIDSLRRVRRPAGRYWLAAGSLFVLCLSGFFQSQLFSAEPHLEFLRGLRERGYYDTAQEYLAELAQRTDIPPDVVALLPYERAVTLLEGARKIVSPQARRQQLDAAQAAFEQFVQSNANHPLVAEANAQRATILKERALVELWDADDPANEQNRSSYQRQARELLLQARAILEQAKTQHEAAFRAFPSPIPEDQVALREQQRAAEQKYLQDVLELAQSTYWEAQTFDSKSKERNELLEKAILGFKGLWVEHRLQVVGLISQLYQAKCFEEMGQIGEALGLYDTLLKNPGTSESIQTLKAKALWFRLICLNHESRHDYQIVIQEATEWKNAAGPRAFSEEGLGIQYEMARAQELLGSDRNRPEPERKKFLDQAIATVQTISKYPGRVKGPSQGMMRRLATALGRNVVDPRTFNDAYGAANNYYEEAKAQIQNHDRLVAAGDSTGAQALMPGLMATAAEMTRLFELALNLAGNATDPQNVATARLQLANGYSIQGKYYEAAVAAEYAAAHMPAESAELARLAALLRMTSYERAALAQPETEREFEHRQMEAAASDIIARWPDSTQATDAREAIARMYVRNGDSAKAAEWWAQVPATAEEYPQSQIRAGQAYWAGYGQELAKPEQERAPAEQLSQWRAAAEQHLIAGINAWQQRLRAEDPTPGDLALGKLSLAQIRNLNGIYTTTGDVPGALEILTQPPHAVVAAVSVPPDEARPSDPKNVRSAQIASLAYQQLLRTYIGLRDLESADKARLRLESVAAGEDSAALTQIYVAFGQELQKELQQLRASGQTARLNEVRTGFEQFLDSISPPKREKGQTFGSLLWIAETYTSLAEGSKDDAGKSKEFFGKASQTYTTMSQMAASDPKFLARPDQKTVISLRLADCYKRAGKFEDAEQAMLAAIKQNPQAPNVQFDAALLYRDWGAAPSGSAERIKTAIEGDAGGQLWGWNQLARRLQQALMSSRRDERLEQMHIDTRYYQAESYRLYANKLPTETEQRKNLTVAKQGIEAFARLAGSLPPGDFTRFDALYRQVREDLGESRQPLDEVLASSSAGSTAKEPSPQVAPAAATTAPSTQTAEPAAKPAKKMSFGLTLGLIVLVCAVGIGGYVWSVQNERSKKKRAKSKLAARGTRVKTK